MRPLIALIILVASILAIQVGGSLTAQGPDCDLELSGIERWKTAGPAEENPPITGAAMVGLDPVPAETIRVIRSVYISLPAWTNPSRICLVEDTGYEGSEGVFADDPGDLQGADCFEGNGWTPAGGFGAAKTNRWILMPGSKLTARVASPMAVGDRVTLKATGWDLSSACLPEILSQ